LKEKDGTVHVRCVIKGEPARMIRELKRRGTVTSFKQAVVQGIYAYYDTILQLDLKRLEVERSRDSTDYTPNEDIAPEH